MILCCAQCAEPIPPHRAGSMCCSGRCGAAFDRDFLADDEGDDDDGYGGD